jgi:cephalosporin hydroxylase
LGHRVAKAPTDLIAYQELIERVRPDWIIETGSANGGRALFLASICELLDHGQVVSIDPQVVDNRAEHPRITYIEGQAQEPDTFARVQEMVGDAPHALVVLGSLPGTNLRIEGEFEVYGRLVPVDSYVIVENTIVNGHPVWPGFGPGPLEAVKRILAQHGEFVADTAMEKYGLTFNPMGFLKRVR